jgi:predicted unusual protein kinase regulating ubiquinone biosynthesis (AarF/ABC1/UbiB family)
MSEQKDKEANSFGGRAARYARVGTGLSGVAAKLATQKVFGLKGDASKDAAMLTEVLGNLKGPLMKVAQLLSTIPEAVPPEYAAELAKLQSSAPPMGPVFVKRRMKAELGADWLSKFGHFDYDAAASASLGQVHKASHHDGTDLAVKLQYPDMGSAVEADLKQLDWALSLYKRLDGAIDTSDIRLEVADRIREELDYIREAKHIALYQNVLKATPEIRVPNVYPELSSKRLLTMQWLEGEPLLNYKDASLEQRNHLSKIMFKAIWQPFVSHAVIHGDPHLGNYTVFAKGEGINLLDYGCIRVFDPKLVEGVVELRAGLAANDRDRIVHSYECWGFEGLTNELIEILNLWARFIYGPLLDDRVRTIADGVAPGDYGRKEAFKVHQALKQNGPVKIPRAFVFSDRAAIGLGSVFLHMKAELNFYQLFEEALEGFSLEAVSDRQSAALQNAGLAPPSTSV